MDLRNRKQNWKALVADSIENEKSRVNPKFLAWVDGSAMMGSTEQKMDSLRKNDEFSFGHSNPYSMAYFQKVLSWDLVYFKVL